MKCGEDMLILELKGFFGEVKIYFKCMEDGDEEVLDMWWNFWELSIKCY